MTEKDYSSRMTPSFLVGVYMAVNAVSDVYLLVDGTDCVVLKAEFLHGTHDLFSTLLDCEGFHRIAHTGIYTHNVIKGSNDLVKAKLLQISGYKRCGAIWLSCLPFCTMAGIDYKRIIDSVRRNVNVPVIHIPGNSLSSDWLDGYAQTWEAVAKNISLPRARAAKNAVAIVGYLMDRTEADHMGNLKELGRMLKALRLELVSVWPDNRLYGQLSGIAKAQTIISLPYAKKAARIISARTGAALIETGLPFGFKGTRRWLEKIADFHGRRKLAEKFINKELSTVIPRIKWIVPHSFLNRKVMFVGEPYIAREFDELMRDLGCSLTCHVFMCLKHHVVTLTRPGGDGENGSQVIIDPKEKGYESALRENLSKGCDLIVSNSRGLSSQVINVPVLEFGFPSNNFHVLEDNPFLGFRGAVRFIERMANAISMGRYLKNAA